MLFPGIYFFAKIKAFYNGNCLLFILPKDLSGLSTIQFRLSFKGHKSLEYCCLEIQTFKLHDLGIFFPCWVHKAQQRSGPESPRLIIIFPQKRKFRARASATSTNFTEKMSLLIRTN